MAFLYILAIVPIGFEAAWALHTVWGWFLVAVWPLTYAQACGAVWVVGLAGMRGRPRPELTDEEIARTLVNYAIGYPIGVGFAWVTKWWLGA